MQLTSDASKIAGSKIGGSALVTGGSGFIGTHLIRRLHSEGVQITSVDQRPPRERVAGVDYHEMDVRDLYRSSISRVDRIFNLAAVHTTPGHPDHEYYDTNISGAISVTRFAETRGIDELIFTSSISVYGPSEERKLETSVPAPVSAYGKSKLIAEQISETWRAGGERRKLVVVRPAVVFGPGEGGNFARMAALLKKGFFVFPGRRDTVKSCIYVDDLIDLILAASASKRKYELLNGAYRECPQLEEIVKTLQRDYFPKAALLDVPKAAVIGTANLLAGLDGVGIGVHPDRVKKLLKSTHVYPGWAVDNDLLPDGSFKRGLEKWAMATGGSFV